MFRFISFMISMSVHVLLGLVLLFRGEPDLVEVPVPIISPDKTEKEPVSQDEKNENPKPIPLEQEMDAQETLQQMRYEVSLKKGKASQNQSGTSTVSEDPQEGMNGQVDNMTDQERKAIPRLVVTNLNRELTDRLIQLQYLIPLIVVRDQLLEEESILLIQKTGSGYRCHPASAAEISQASSRALPVEHSVENEIRNALVRSSENLPSGQRVRFHLSNHLDQMVALRQQQAVKQSGRSAQASTTYGHFDLSGSRVDFIVDRVK